MKKYLSFLLAVLMVLSLVPMSAMAEDDRPTISVVILDRSAVPADQGTYEDNWATRWINENAPVKVEFVACDRWSAHSNYNLWLASGECPDVIMEFQPEYVEEWANAGMLIDMGPYLDEYAPNYRALTPESVQAWGMYSDGEYAIAQERFGSSIVNHMVYVRTDWLENLGLSMPTSWEEFEEVIRAFSEDDPDQNGIDDTWGWSMISQYQQVTRAMAGAYGNAWYKQEDGTLENSVLTEECLQAMKFLEKCVDNGWCDKEWLTNPDDQYSQFATGKVGFLACEHVYLPTKAWATLKANFPEATVDFMPSFTEYGYYQERECQLLSCVPTTCDNPEAVAQYIDWMITNGWEMLAWGEEGVDFENRNGLYVDLLSADERAAKLAYTNEYAIVNPYGMSGEMFLASKEAMDDSNELKEAYLIEARAVLETEKIKARRDVPTENLGVQEAVEYMPEMLTFANEAFAKALLDPEYTMEQAQADIAAEWEMMDYEMVKDAINARRQELGL